MSEANASPFDFSEARAAVRKASSSQAATENAYLEASRVRAQAERAYRQALAARILKANAVEGVAWSVAADIARGDPEVAQLRYGRDVANGVVEAHSQAGWRHAADRRDLARLIGWSEKVSPLGDQTEPGRLRSVT